MTKNIIVMVDGVPYRLVPLTEIPTTQTSISECGLGVRTEKALSMSGIEHLEQVLEKTEVDLLRLPTFGRKSLNEIRGILALKWPHLRIGQYKRE